MFNLKNFKKAQTENDVFLNNIDETMEDLDLDTIVPSDTPTDSVEVDNNPVEEVEEDNVVDEVLDDTKRDLVISLFAVLDDQTKDQIGAKYGSIDGFVEYLNTADPIEVSQDLRFLVPAGNDADLEKIKSFIDDYYNESAMLSNKNIFEAKPQTTDVNLAFVSNIEKEIKLAAEQDAKKNKKPFNLKLAQAKGLNNVLMYGPEQVRYDAFSRLPVSDWHIIERNKGFGGRVGDVWNYDWEAFWRGNIMDKYSRPYKDADGNWVGGYLEKRFEVDHWIPEGNNYQLKPGQLRKPILPEYGLIEGRLESARSKSEYAEEHKPDSQGEPFDWTEASSVVDNLKKISNVAKDLICLKKDISDTTAKDGLTKAANNLIDILEKEAESDSLDASADYFKNKIDEFQGNITSTVELLKKSSNSQHIIEKIASVADLKKKLLK